MFFSFACLHDCLIIAFVLITIFDAREKREILREWGKINIEIWKIVKIGIYLNFPRRRFINTMVDGYVITCQIFARYARVSLGWVEIRHTSILCNFDR